MVLLSLVPESLHRSSHTRRESQHQIYFFALHHALIFAQEASFFQNL